MKKPNFTMSRLVLVATMIVFSFNFCYSQTTIVNYDFDNGTNYAGLVSNTASNISCEINGQPSFRACKWTWAAIWSAGIHYK
jgi:hypothetical protein